MMVYLYRTGAFETARAFTEECIAHWSAHSGADDADVIAAERSLGAILRDSGEFRAALELTRSTLDKARRVLGPDSEITLALMTGYSADLRSQGDFAVGRDIDGEAVSSWCGPSAGTTRGRCARRTTWVSTSASQATTRRPETSCSARSWRRARRRRALAGSTCSAPGATCRGWYGWPGSTPRRGCSRKTPMSSAGRNSALTTHGRCASARNCPSRSGWQASPPMTW